MLGVLASRVGSTDKASGGLTSSGGLTGRAVCSKSGGPTDRVVCSKSGGPTVGRTDNAEMGDDEEAINDDDAQEGAGDDESSNDDEDAEQGADDDDDGNASDDDDDDTKERVSDRTSDGAPGLRGCQISGVSLHRTTALPLCRSCGGTGDSRRQYSLVSDAAVSLKAEN